MSTRIRSLRRYSPANNSDCSIRKQLVCREPCYLGDSLQQFQRRQVPAVLDVGNSRLADGETPCQFRLRQARALAIGFQGYHHMDAETIGITYRCAIGHSYPGFTHAFDMAKQVRSVYDRAMEALAERFPNQKATQAKLASVAGVRQPSVNDWKDGYPAMDTAVRLATALGVCVEWLLTERGPKHPPQAENSTLALLLSQLNDRQKARLAKLAEVLKDDT
jgi:hypothetical protein